MSVFRDNRRKFVYEDDENKENFHFIGVLGERVLSRQFITKAKKLNGVRDPPLGIKRKEKLRAILMRFE